MFISLGRFSGLGVGDESMGKMVVDICCIFFCMAFSGCICGGAWPYVKREVCHDS